MLGSWHWSGCLSAAVLPMITININRVFLATKLGFYLKFQEISMAFFVISSIVRFDVIDLKIF
jgi:hypothetical protein